MFGECLEKVDLVICDIFLIFENDCGIFFGYVDLVIDVVFVDVDLICVLVVEEGVLIMCIECLIYVVDGVLLDFEYFYYCGDVF